MAAGSLLSLLDDIATLLDDVALLTKTAAKKTAGVLGDDLALNAEQVVGIHADRELPVVWAVFKGSALNKVVIVPLALVISAVAPVVVTGLLVLGGLFLCFEGFEKLAHKLLGQGDDSEQRRAHIRALIDPEIDMVEFERAKIKGAIRTDVVLSAEIIVIALGIVATQPLLTRALVLAAIAAAMTIGVYGFVAALVKLDDLGLALSQRSSASARRIGRGLLWVAPHLMKALGLAGTAAMFLVGGGIVTHAIGPLQRWVESSGGMVAMLVHAVVGVVAGALVGGALTLVKRIARARSK